MTTEVAISAADRARAAGARRIVLVTGLSGAGRTSALKVLEDLGFEAADNLPLTWLTDFLAGENSGAAGAPLAVGVDIRSRNFTPATFVDLVRRLRQRSEVSLSVLFLDCDDEVLMRRFSETRRRHPLAGDRPLRDGIRRERELLALVRGEADLVIDTSHLHTRDLRRQLQANFGADSAATLAVFITSFSYRQGLPRDADLVFDVRFLANPHYEPDLQPLTGQDPRIQAYIERDPSFAPFFNNLTAMLSSLLPRYNHEGKSYLTIAIGCTGGQHRSVSVAERLAAWMGENGYPATVIHRDIGAAVHE
jgi:UPF0042 nucleotide-binding protein